MISVCVFCVRIHHNTLHNLIIAWKINSFYGKIPIRYIHIEICILLYYCLPFEQPVGTDASIHLLGLNREITAYLSHGGVPKRWFKVIQSNDDLIMWRNYIDLKTPCPSWLWLCWNVSTVLSLLVNLKLFTGQRFAYSDMQKYELNKYV